jgi:hypothetical protein
MNFEVKGTGRTRVVTHPECGRDIFRKIMANPG